MATDARGRLILSTIDLVRSHGVAGFGITELLARSGVARRSLYLNFPGGKDELVAEATRVAGAVVGADLARPGPDEDLDATVARYVASWRTALAESDFTAGCPVVAAALAGAAAPSAPPAAGAAFAAWEAHLAERLTAAGIAPDAAAPLATTVVAAVEGAVVLAIARRTTAPLDAVEAHLVDLLALARSR